MHADYRDIQSAKPIQCTTYRHLSSHEPLANANVQLQVAFNSGLFPQNHVGQNMTQYNIQPYVLTRDVSSRTQSDQSLVLFCTAYAQYSSERPLNSAKWSKRAANRPPLSSVQE
jgi:hypothetical protein